jgi:hypothetical protein
MILLMILALGFVLAKIQYHSLLSLNRVTCHYFNCGTVLRDSLFFYFFMGLRDSHYERPKRTEGMADVIKRKTAETLKLYCEQSFHLFLEGANKNNVINN